MVDCFDKGGYTTQLGIIISHYKDPYEPNSMKGWHKGFEGCSDGDGSVEKVNGFERWIVFIAEKCITKQSPAMLADLRLTVKYGLVSKTSKHNLCFGL